MITSVNLNNGNNHIQFPSEKFIRALYILAYDNVIAVGTVVPYDEPRRYEVEIKTNQLAEVGDSSIRAAGSTPMIYNQNNVLPTDKVFAVIPKSDYLSYIGGNIVTRDLIVVASFTCDNLYLVIEYSGLDYNP